MSNHVVGHLVRRGGVYCFRMAVPRALWDRIGLREFKGSLKTGDAFTARQRCRKLSNAFELLIDKVRAMPDLSQDTIRGLVRGYFQQWLDKGEEIALLMPDDPMQDATFEANELGTEAERLREALFRCSHDRITISGALSVLKDIGLSRADVDLEQFETLCQGIQRARIENNRILAAKLLKRHDLTAPLDPLFAGMMGTLQPFGEEKTGGERTVGALADLYCSQKEGKEWVGKTTMDNRRVVKLVIDLVGTARPITSLGTEDIRRLRDTLAKLPSNHSKNKAFDGMSLEQIIASGLGTPLSVKTQDKYFIMFRSFLNWCVAEGYLTAVPGATIRVIGANKVSSKLSRLPFTAEQLTLLFSSPLYTGCRSAGRRLEAGDTLIRDGKYWIPLIGLYSGMRLGEIVQLLISDLKTDQGIPYFDINKGEGEDDKQVKTASSIRKVPVHPDLIALGLLDHVEQQRKTAPKGRIFPDIQPGTDGYYSAVFSKWFSRTATALGVKGKKTTFHSLRHNFKDALSRGGVSVKHAKALMGHADEGTHEDYGSEGTVPDLRESLEKARFEIDIKSLITIEK